MAASRQQQSVLWDSLIQLVKEQKWELLWLVIPSLDKSKLMKAEIALLDRMLELALPGYSKLPVSTRNVINLFCLGYNHDWEQIFITLTSIDKNNLTEQEKGVLGIILSVALHDNTIESNQLAAFVLAFGANPNISGLQMLSNFPIAYYVRLPLNTAAERKDQQLVLKLLAAGADPNKGEDLTALKSLGAEGDEDTPIVTLAKKKAWGFMPFFISAAGVPLDSNELGHALLLAINEYVQDQAARQRPLTAPDISPVSLTIEIIEALLIAGANPNFRKPGEDCALHTAIKQANRDLIRILFLYGADPKMKDKNGSNIFEYAKKCDPACLKMIEEEVQYMADLRKARDGYMRGIAPIRASTSTTLTTLVDLPQELQVQIFTLAYGELFKKTAFSSTEKFTLTKPDDIEKLVADRIKKMKKQLEEIIPRLKPSIIHEQTFFSANIRKVDMKPAETLAPAASSCTLL